LLEIDNGTAERVLRAVVLGRKNFLFVGHDCGGDRAAAMCSLIISAKLSRPDPKLYLRTVLTRFADHPVSEIQKLLPWNMANSLFTIRVDHSSGAHQRTSGHLMAHSLQQTFGNLSMREYEPHTTRIGVKPCPAHSRKQRDLFAHGLSCLEYLSQHCCKRKAVEITNRGRTEGAMRFLCFHPNLLLELD
jgi:hypothetical protein